MLSLTRLNSVTKQKKIDCYFLILVAGLDGQNKNNDGKKYWPSGLKSWFFLKSRLFYKIRLFARTAQNGNGLGAVAWFSLGSRVTFLWSRDEAKHVLHAAYVRSDRLASWGRISGNSPDSTEGNCRTYWIVAEDSTIWINNNFTISNTRGCWLARMLGVVFKTGTYTYLSKLYLKKQNY